MLIFKYTNCCYFTFVSKFSQSANEKMITIYVQVEAINISLLFIYSSYTEAEAFN